MRTMRLIGLLSLSLLAGSCASKRPLAFPKIDRIPRPSNRRRYEIHAVPAYDPNSTNAFQVDLRGADLSNADLTRCRDSLLHAVFDTETIWPDSKQMPREFDWKKIMEMGKNPGLGIRNLHKEGITGKDVGIAILDQPMLVNHWEYAKCLRSYEEINIREGTHSQMHGPAVASIAVGQTVGVAPEADLYYIALWNGDSDKGELTWNFRYLARGVNRVLEMNEHLPQDKKIRVISISVGWDPSQKGYDEITDAVQRARSAGMFIICSSTETIHGFKFNGLGRSPLADPDNFNSYRPGLFWARQFYDTEQCQGCLLVPMDARTTASPTGINEYVFYGVGGWSWAVPYIAGVYALATQVDSTITPERFWALAMKTGRTIDLRHKRRTIPFGPILDPAALIEAIKAGVLSDKAVVAAELTKYATRHTLTVPVCPFCRGINAKVAQIDMNTATRNDVIKIFGEPVKYAWGKQVLKKDTLPDRYVMCYPGDCLFVLIRDECVMELRFQTPNYVFRDTIHVGSTLEDVLRTLGSPTETVTGKKNGRKDGVLYKDIGGRKGYCYYSRKDQGVRMFFLNNKVIALYVTRPAPLFDEQ